MTTEDDKKFDLSAIRARLAGARGRDYWRGLEEVADEPAFREYLAQEFPNEAYVWNQPLSRRELLKLTGATLALAGLAACKNTPLEKIVPYAKQPEEIVPGKPLYFATALTLGGFARGVLVESHLGRPTKIEANPDHPEGSGSDVFLQAAILDLYDPDRSATVQRKGQLNTWAAFATAVSEQMTTQKNKRGAGLRILSETVTSPTLAWQIQQILSKYPEARWHQYEPANRDNSLAGAKQSFGEPVNTIYHFDKADRVVSLDADFMFSGPGHIRYAKNFMDRRRVAAGGQEMNRLYVVEPTPSVTGSAADHRFPLAPADIPRFAQVLAEALRDRRPSVATSPVSWMGWALAMAEDLLAHRGRSIVLAGEGQPASVHALCHAMNAALGNIGETVFYTAAVEAKPENQTQSLFDLVEAMDAGQVDALLILGGNPVYTAPADLRFADRLHKVPFSAHLGLYVNETSHLTLWHVPQAHELEAWGDARAFDGTLTVQQPLIEPLYGGKSALQVMAALDGESAAPDEILKNYWRAKTGGGNFDKFWRKTLHDGVMENSRSAPRRLEPRRAVESPEAGGAAGFTVVFRPDPTLWDGRFANNGWLQEAPKPITNLTWDNALLTAPATAEKLGLANEDVVELEVQGRRVKAPVWVLPGQAPDTFTLHLGSGRVKAGRVGDAVGANAYLLRGAGNPWQASGVQAKKTGRRHKLACTQLHHSMNGRDLVRSGTLDELQKDPHFAQKADHTPLKAMYTFNNTGENAWGMHIDLTACIGCNACVVGCQAENNIPIVGKQQVLKGREMHWIRVDRYYKGDLDNPQILNAPVPCMQCENAPCEPVCPVEATTHSHEGLNEMTYNRCVGTRYCANNCPYKVRRFNFYKYTDEKTPQLKLMRNPDVTVRTRGVMEKCTYCVQRINNARIDAAKQNRPIKDGEIETACQGACPTQAITFGDVKDPESRVSKLKAQPLNYGMLVELNTRPRTTYAARVTNPNPALAGAQPAPVAEH